MFYARVGKRTFDVTAAVVGLTLLAPLLALVWLAVRVTLGTPVLFRQRRTGLHGCTFTLLKFRTMNNQTDDEGRLLPDAYRLTRLGRFLRTFSIDELPELWNVVRGEMSLVGPRPLLPEYLPRYSRRQSRRHEVTPGITGWAQVNGRNALDWNTKFELDVWYVDHLSFSLDVQILGRTLLQLLTGRGIAYPGSATAPEFMGGARET